MLSFPNSPDSSETLTAAAFASKDQAGIVSRRFAAPLQMPHIRLNPAAKIILTTRPTPIQAKAFKLLGLNPACTQ